MASVISSQKLSRREVKDVFVLTAFGIHVWTILAVLVDVPAWLLQMSVPELAGAISYSLVYALVETLLVALGLIAVGFIIPARLRKDNFLVWAILLFLWFFGLALALFNDPSLVFQKQALARLFLLTFLPTAALFSVLNPVKRALAWLAETVAILVGGYLAMDLIALAIVIIRNI
ncbi:MAG: hypothetical protein EPO32_07215 [Anaerolineae bacterium]|nr:MAG: hypothetical protein EPO32_07215 [Anaerolineae bacterium]